jgi:hypothetical protein
MPDEIFFIRLLNRLLQVAEFLNFTHTHRHHRHTDTGTHTQTQTPTPTPTPTPTQTQTHTHTGAVVACLIIRLLQLQLQRLLDVSEFLASRRITGITETLQHAHVLHLG